MTDPPARVLCLVPVSGPWHGAQRQSVAIVDELRRRFAAVKVIDMAQAADSRDFNKPRVKKFIAAVGLIAKAWCAAERGACVYVNVATGGLAMGRDLMALTLLRLTTSRVTAHLHTVPASRSARTLLRLVLSDVQVISVNSRIAALLPGRAPRLVQPNAVAACPSPCAADWRRRRVEGRLLYVGRLSQAKGLGDALRLYERTRARLPGVSLDLVGEIGDEPSRAALAAATARTHLVRWHGPLAPPKLAKVYSRAAALLFTSAPYSEGSPLVVREALAHGLPVVASRQLDADDWLAECGIVYDPQRPRLAEDALVQLLSEPRQYEAVAARARDLGQGRLNFDAYMERLTLAISWSPSSFSQ